MLEALQQRTVVIGHSGAGKSLFAESLAVLTNAPVIDLDRLHWEDDGHGPKRDEETAKRLVRDAAAASRWIIEGVYGWLAAVALPEATALVWLDFPWSLCREGLLARGRRRATEADFADLLVWAEAYWVRQTSTSFQGHARLFEGFPGIKLRLRDRPEVEKLFAQLEKEEP